MPGKAQLSFLVSVHNLEQSIESLLDSMHLPDVEGIEYVLTDRASEDQTLICAIQKMREIGMTAVTIQNGFGTGASALNTALFHASGDFVKFITPPVYGKKSAELYRRGKLTGLPCDILLPVPKDMLDAPQAVSGLTALERLIHANRVPEAGSILYAKKLVHEKGLRLTDTPQMPGLGLEFTIKALAHAGSVLLIPMDCRPVGIRKDLFIETETEFSSLQRVDATYRAVEELRRIPAIRPSILDNLLNYYIPQKLLECIEELLQSGLGYAAITNYLRIHRYDRFCHTRSIKDRTLKNKLLIWRRVPWMYKPDKK